LRPCGFSSSKDYRFGHTGGPTANGAPHESRRLRLHRRRAEAVWRDAPLSAVGRDASGVLRVAGPAGESRRREDRDLLEAMRAIFEGSGGTYGSRIQEGLAGQGHHVSRRRVERLMRADGMRGRVARVYRPKAGTHRWFRRQPNHVRRTHATRPNQIWVGDVTYLGVGGRWWYLIVVLDQCSRRVLAWRLAATRDSRVTRAVLNAALRRRRPDADLIFHSDRGSEFQGTPVRTRLAASGVRQSMTRGGAPGENAHMESFFHSLKADLIHGRSFGMVADLRPGAPSVRAVLQLPATAFVAGLSVAR
jgi:putative transposase